VFDHRLFLLPCLYGRKNPEDLTAQTGTFPRAFGCKKVRFLSSVYSKAVGKKDRAVGLSTIPPATHFSKPERKNHEKNS
jgi:hypothetical protein